MGAMVHLTLAEMEAALPFIGQSPRDGGRVEMIVRRPGVDLREALEEGLLNLSEGLVGDTWKTRPSPRSADGLAHPDMQLNLMNARVIGLLAREESRWALAGDQLYVDLDLSEENLPAWTRLAIGEAIIQITDQPHTGCKKFGARFGAEALKFVNSDQGKRLRLRGVNAKVLMGGRIRRGDGVVKV